ncbi:type II toxin-antitoxin system death-on-curing family toxin [Snodgrassella sp. ESL0253]|uniref:type II toxin-antitoxin system death-on-curing family toxin n=1 Tax=Snodgrassella sp. ESL0253 TaxID=2705031 RepID=UPI001583B8F6|nr:type II toxin-antitoxin system death-on-curing family toxin [Snodgrassella sp. ESL0253]NUE67266.1 type II toxin-antitoxin system death-on-curing family toxin [Snodgrassella sp. ESL0253]
MSSVVYLEQDEVIANHDKIILVSGGLLGIRDEGLLISALTMIQNDLYYPTFSSKLVHLIFSINKNHCFSDGNKRTSLSSGASFLLKNGWPLEFVKAFIINMEEVVVWLADDEINKDDLALIIDILFLGFEINKDSSKEKSATELIDFYKEINIEYEELDLFSQNMFNKEDLVELKLIIQLKQKHKKIGKLILQMFTK